MQTLQIEQLTTRVFDSNTDLGKAGAQHFANVVSQEIAERGEAAVILATGNSQLTFMQALHNEQIQWDKITVFHMDEYVGLSAENPASFRRYIREKIANVFQPQQVHYMQGDADDIQAEITRYSGLLTAAKPVITVMGIGENGHLAFNDPPADFDTSADVHVVTLDYACRAQQVGEGHFATVEDVPPTAITLTVPALLKPPHVLTLVPEARKATAVRAALHGPLSPECPASILRTQAHAQLFLDQESAALL